MSGRPLVLNIDDTQQSRYSKTRVLQHAGYEVVEGGTGTEALRLVRELQPELVLLDVRLPDMSGLDVCRRIKQDPASANIPVIQISATFVTDEDQKNGLKGGADIYLTEPLEPKELETVVNVLLRLRRTEAGLAENEKRWQRLVDANVVGVVVVEDNRITEANELFLSMLGYTREELQQGRITIQSITPPEQLEATEQLLADVVEHGSCAPFEKEYVRKNGLRVNVVVGGAVLDRRRRRWMMLVLDMSEHKRMEMEREQALARERTAREQAEEATRLKDEFLANLSHELRTPMNIIIGWGHLLRHGALDEGQRRRAAEAIERAARSQAQLIEDLLDVSRIVTGKFRLTMQDVEVGPVLKQAVESIRLVAHAKQVVLTLSQKAGDAKVTGDPDRLQQVFWNLLSNAVKFTSGGGCVDVRLDRSETHVRITVTDTGIGIAREFLPYVFDRFRQADSTSARRHAGMGLGLAIVRHAVELHGGSVHADSPGENAGTTFTVLLPLLTYSSAADGGRPEDTDPLEIAHTPHRPTRVLLIEDDADAREVAAAGLEGAGFELRAVSTGREALEILEHWPADVVVSDIGMPGMDGYEFIRQLRARPPERGGRVAALALTAFARLDDSARARSSGYQGHLSKPISPQDLAVAIASLKRRLDSDPSSEGEAPICYSARPSPPPPII
jgi:PAS domain S-box-containing protein